MFDRFTEESRLDDAALSGEYDDELDDEWDGGWRSRGRRFARRQLMRLAWLVAAATIALGSAGIVNAEQHYPALGGRDELTWGADQAEIPRLDAALSELRGLVSDVDGLGDMARQARSALTQQNRVKLDAATRTGRAQIEQISTRTANLRSSLGCGDPSVRAAMETANSSRISDRYDAACSALDATASLREEWTVLVAGAADAMDITDLMATHDKDAAAALQLGSAGKYQKAIEQLALATNQLASIRPRYETLSKTTDLWTLGEWIDRSQTMDDALRGLWQAMIDSHGIVTAKVRQALQAVDDAKRQLPANSQYVSVVLAELASAGVNQAGISIETARAELSSAVNGLTDLSSSNG